MVEVSCVYSAHSVLLVNTLVCGNEALIENGVDGCVYVSENHIAHRRYSVGELCPKWPSSWARSVGRLCLNYVANSLGCRKRE